MECRFLPVRMIHVVGYGKQILNNRLGTNDAHLGHNWGRRLLERHSSELQVTTSKRIDEHRVMAKNPVYVMEFYVILSNAIKDLSIDASKIFNMDEKGYLLGITGKEKVVIMRRDSQDGYAGGAKDCKW
ncbi:pogo transposable element protein, putative, partial [Rhizoctonia solani AG-3 Rhs1AP]